MALSLLLADDQPAIAKIISLSLPREEYEIRSVTSVKEAMNAIGESHPDFVLADVSLRFDAALDPVLNPNDPDIKKDGIFLTRYIKDHDALKSVKVLLLTNAFEPIDEATRERYNADGVLVKPFDPSELRSALRSLMTPEHQAKLTSGSNQSAAPGLPSNNPWRDTPPPAPGLGPGETIPVNPELVDEPTVNLPALDLRADPLESNDNDLTDATLDLHAYDNPTDDIELSPEAQELSSFFEAEIERGSAQRLTPPAPPVVTQNFSPNTPKESFHSESFRREPPPFPDEPNNDGNSDAFTIDENLSHMPESLDSAAEEWKPVHQNLESDLSNWQQSNTNESDMLFDVGGSNFQFDADYILRVRHTEDAREERAQHSLRNEDLSQNDRFRLVPSDDEEQTTRISEISQREITKRIDLLEKQAEEKIRSSIDQASQALSEQAASHLNDQISISRANLEKIVKEETRKQCAELVEKIAWDIIPELAENIIRKELEKVLTALEKDPE